jgi:hypothetical protein
MLAVVPSAGAGVLDQSQTKLGSTFQVVWDAQLVAQTFTAGITGRLDQVDVAVDKFPSVGTVPLTVEIRGVSSGVPSGPALASASVPAASVPHTFPVEFVSVPLAPPASVTAGIQYAIVLSSFCGSPGCYGWNIEYPDPYPGRGMAISLRPMDSPDWIPLPFNDLAFKTYVAPPVVPPVVRPRNKAECKKGGWRRFTNPSFKNQGQCIAYVNHHNGKGKGDSKSNGKKKGKKQ